MKFHALFTFLSALLLSYTCAATSSPAAHLEKRATQVSVTSYTFTNNVLAGSIKVQNLAYTKVVTVVYAVGSTWTTSQSFAAAYSSGPASDGYEVWTFSGTAVGATQFYVKYDVSGTSYYDPGNSVNYQISATTSSTTTSAAQCTVTVTTTMPLALMPRMAEVTGIF
ncbi:uncharacterized protein H6S33_006613 [Morchella sextelata]|uniref:uncharacterized protein n=1 Tax=Morchella sextelata TaxID=1174677 RepID=UPI001D04BA63|nr:uncharacterized protein H6S33_006613 [Morchella sextelata]KAH0604236.1 hypothetical protein H6S33_006613 [Morchella sextelata]